VGSGEAHHGEGWMMAEETPDENLLYNSPSEAIEQVEKCNFECEGGSLANNTGWRWIKRTLLEMQEALEDGDDVTVVHSISFDEDGEGRAVSLFNEHGAFVGYIIWSDLQTVNRLNSNEPWRVKDIEHSAVAGRDIIYLMNDDLLRDATRLLLPKGGE
jgi:hypothetical protein